MSVNGTYQFGITNSWGVSGVFQTYDNVAHIPPPPDQEYFLMTFFGFLVAGLYFIDKTARGLRHSLIASLRRIFSTLAT
jgi:hypothetical protein